MYFLQNEKIGLRNLEPEDLEGEYKDWFNDETVCEGNGHHKFPMSITELKRFVETANVSKTEIVMAVVVKDDGRHIGNISLQKIDLLNRSAEIAFMFGNKDYWNKGYGTMAAKLMIQHAFEELGMNRIYFGTLENNLGMQKLGDKLRFKRAGTQRKALYKHGKFMDIYNYDLLKTEWFENETT